jgi:hypothetical protein
VRVAITWRDRAILPDSERLKKQPGYFEIRAASRLHPKSGAWAFFMREIVRLPPAMTPAVLQVIHIGRWRDSTDPVESVRSDALEAYERAWAKPGTSRPKQFLAAL